MQMEARPQTGWSQKQKANALKFSSLGRRFFLFIFFACMKMSVADRFTCLCSVHLFWGAALETSEKRSKNNHLSNVKERLGRESFTFDWSCTKTPKKGQATSEHIKECGFSLQLLTALPELIAAPGSCFIGANSFSLRGCCNVTHEDRPDLSLNSLAGMKLLAQLKKTNHSCGGLINPIVGLWVGMASSHFHVDLRKQWMGGSVHE